MVLDLGAKDGSRGAAYRPIRPRPRSLMDWGHEIRRRDEAEGISGFVSNSPLMSWVYSVFSIRSFSALLGVTEIVIGLLIAARPLSARAALVGSAAAVGMFLTTLSFLLTTPGVWEASAGGFPALSVVPGQFLVKDFVLFGASLWMCGEDWRALTTCRSPATRQVTTTHKPSSKRRLP